MDCWGSCWAVLMGKISQAERWILFVMLRRPPSTIGQGGILCCMLSLSELSWHCVSAPAAPASIFQTQAHRTYVAHTHTHTHTLAAATELSQTIIKECFLSYSISVSIVLTFTPFSVSKCVHQLSLSLISLTHKDAKTKLEKKEKDRGLRGGCKQMRIVWYRSQRERSVRWESEGCEEDMQRGEKLLCSGCPWDSWNRHNKTFFQREREAVSVCMSEGRGGEGRGH